MKRRYPLLLLAGIGTAFYFGRPVSNSPKVIPSKTATLKQVAVKQQIDNRAAAIQKKKPTDFDCWHQLKEQMKCDRTCYFNYIRKQHSHLADILDEGWFDVPAKVRNPLSPMGLYAFASEQAGTLQYQSSYGIERDMTAAISNMTALARQDFPNMAPALALATIYYRLGKFKKAESWLKQAASREVYDDYTHTWARGLMAVSTRNSEHFIHALELGSEAPMGSLIDQKMLKTYPIEGLVIARKLITKTVPGKTLLANFNFSIFSHIVGVHALREISPTEALEAGEYSELMEHSNKIFEDEGLNDFYKSPENCSLGAIRRMAKFYQRVLNEQDESP